MSNSVCAIGALVEGDVIEIMGQAYIVQKVATKDGRTALAVSWVQTPRKLMLISSQPSDSMCELVQE